MKIIIKTTNIELNQALRELIETKLSPLERFYQDLSKEDILPTGERKLRQEVFLEIGKTTQGQKKGDVFRAEAQITLSGESIRVVTVSHNLRIVVDEIKDKLQREIKEFKEKREVQFKRGARALKRETKVSEEAKWREEGERVREEGL